MKISDETVLTRTFKPMLFHQFRISLFSRFSRNPSLNPMFIPSLVIVAALFFLDFQGISANNFNNEMDETALEDSSLAQGNIEYIATRTIW